MSSFEFAEELTPQQTHRINFAKFLSNHKLAVTNYTQRVVDRFVELEHFHDFFGEPIYMNFNPPEVQRFDEMIQGENIVQRKCLVVFSNLVHEMDYLSRICEEHFFPPLAVYGEIVPEPEPQNLENLDDEEMDLVNKQQEWDFQVNFGRFISLLTKVWNFVRRCEVVVKNCIQQTALFFKNCQNHPDFQYFKAVQLNAVFFSLGNLLKQLVILDTIIEQNLFLVPQSQLYVKMLLDVEKKESRFKIHKIDVQKLIFLLEKINKGVLDRMIFSNIVNLRYDDPDQGIMVAAVANFKTSFLRNIHQLYHHVVQDKIARRSDKVINLFALYVFYRRLWNDPTDVKFFKSMWDLNDKVLILHVYANMYWTIPDFVNEFLSGDLVQSVKFPQKDLDKSTMKFFSGQLDSKMAKLTQLMTYWYSSIRSKYKDHPKLMFLREKQVLDGLLLSYRISHFVKKIIFFSIHKNRALKPDSVLMICKCMQFLKEIQVTFFDLSLEFGDLITKVIESHTYRIQVHYIAVEKMLKEKEAAPDVTEAIIKNLRSVQTCLNLITGSPSRKRLIASRLAMDFCPKQYLGKKEQIDISSRLKRIRTLCNLKDLLKKSTDCSFLFWNPDIAFYFFRHLSQNPERAYKLPMILLALEDCRHILESEEHLRERKDELDLKLPELLKKEDPKIIEEASEADGEKKAEESGENGEDSPKENGLEDLPPPPPEEDGPPLPDLPDLPDLPEEEEETEGEEEEEVEVNIETNDSGVPPLVKFFEESVIISIRECIIEPLGREVEKYLRLNVISNDTSNYDPSGRSIKSIEHYFNLRPIRFFNHTLDMKESVREYLNRLFYEYTTLQQTDWKIYEEMRNLFHSLYRIPLQEGYLPKQITHQGEDILDVTKNIQTIVQTYSYNFNNNMFIQRPDRVEDKKLKTILVRHVSNSIRTHGTGIMNTTVAFIFRFLKEKLFSFSRFLFDEHIHGRLVKDVRFFKEKALELDNMYPVERAMDFVIKIKKLGVEGGQTFLDKFRDLIIQIGNSLGYVRMVRAGGLRHVHSAVRYVPGLMDIPDFGELMEKEEKFSEYSKKCGKTLTDVVHNYSEKFEHGSDYFVKLEEAFSKMLLDSEHKHLESFYVIVPPLTISYIDDMIYGKEQMSRRSKFSKFTNDGFALGVSFILKALKQVGMFNSLNWFDSCEKYFARQARMEESNSSSLTRATVYLKEFKLLFYGFNCTKIFLY